MNISTTALANTIAAFRRLTAFASVSPDSLGAILEALRLAIGSTASGAAADTDLQKISARLQSLEKTASVLSPVNSPGCVPVLSSEGRLPAAVLPEAGTLFSAILPWIWTLMTDDGYKSQAFLFCDDLEFPGGQNVLANGYYPGLHPTRPYFMHGAFYSVQQAAEILFDRWVIGSGGIMQRAHANIPQEVKASDSRITMAYTATNNWNPYTIAIGLRGVRSEIEPTSIYRAFHGAGALRAVIGTISLKRVTSQFEASSAFLNCPELRFVLLRRIADCITELDLSGCSPLIAETMRFDDADAQMSAVTFNPVKYLFENIDDPDSGFWRDPDAPLLIKFPAGVPARIMATSDLMAAYRAAREAHPGLRVEGMIV